MLSYQYAIYLSPTKKYNILNNMVSIISYMDYNILQNF